MTQERFEPTVSVTIGGRSFAWKERVDATARNLRHGRDAAAASVNIAVGAIGVVALVLAGVQAAVLHDLSLLLTREFWSVPSLVGFLVSLAGLCVCFLFYRRLHARSHHATMPKRRDEAAATVGPVSGPVEDAAILFTPEAERCVEEAYGFAQKYAHAAVVPLHLAVGAMSGDDVAVLFGRLGIAFDQVKDPIAHRLQSLPSGGNTALSPEAETVLLEALADSYREGTKAVEPLDVFAAAVRHEPFFTELFFGLGVDEKAFANGVAWIRINAVLRDRYHQFREAAAHKPTGAMDRAMTAVATRALDAVSDDLTAEAVYGRLPLLVGREAEMANLLRSIEGGHQSVILVGSAGVGKAAVLAGLAERMVEERVPKILQDKRLVSLSLPLLLAGGTPDEAQARLLAVLNDVAHARNIVLVIQNIDQILSAPELTPVLGDALARGFAFAVATITPEAYADFERSPLGRLFQKISLPEPGRDEAIRVLESKVGAIENEIGAIFTYEALSQAVALTDRYMHDAFLPEKAIEVCREAALQVQKTRGKDALIVGEDVAAIVSEKARVPVTKVAEGEKDTLMHLEERMRGRVIGQDEAVKAVASALRRARAELRSEKRPIATFLFLGPTGVGKTELAKTVAEAYFGSENALLRFDMSEYGRSDSVARLIGVPGSGQGGLLTEAVRHQPFSIILLDELEKANPDVLNLFLQVFDDGRLTDSVGRTVDFTNAVIICTSNAGAAYVQDAIGAGTPLDQIKTHLMEEELRAIYRPEFLNRFDGLIVFRPLSMDDVGQIAYLLVGKVAQRLEPKGIHFRAADAAIAELAQKGYDPKFGARPLRRVVQEEVENAIANALLEGRAKRRDTIVLEAGGQIKVETAPPL